MDTLRAGLLLPCFAVALACGPGADRRAPVRREAPGSASPSSAAAAPDTTPGIDPLCPGVENSLECARMIERVALRADRPDVRRSGDSLLLRLRDGSYRALVDSGDGDEVVRFSYRQHLRDLGLYVVHEQYYEGSAYNLVSDRSGRSFYAPELPVVSPNRERLASASAELETGYSPNQLLVWRVTGDSVAAEFELKPDGWGMADPVWVNDTTLRVTKVVPDPRTGEHRRSPLTVRLRAGRWRADPAPPAA